MITKSIALASALIALGTHAVSAAVLIEDVTFTNTQLSLTFSGTLDGPLPSSLKRSLAIVATDPADNDWVVGSDVSLLSGVSVNTFTVNGVSISIASVTTIGGSRVIYFQSNGGFFAVGNSVNGTFTATLPNGLFDLSKLDSDLKLVWGSNNGSMQQGVNLGAIEVTAIPEPQTYAAVVGLVALGLVASRRSRRVTAA